MSNQRRQNADNRAKLRLKETAFVFLDENIKALILEAIDECFKDDINHFMDNSPPRALYPYDERVHYVIKAIFRQNLHLFKGLGADGTNEKGDYVDCFGDTIDDPVLEELFLPGYVYPRGAQQ
ncbi:hypothetical protein PG993_015036 [Apiospora rasikravindrae]|uniref:Phage gp6-like head-tail connector protein n=1 Tax=Apiospora rasikravindrae TaxID=990691 RepID=A0ABR1RPN3_9PEZI